MQSDGPSLYHKGHSTAGGREGRYPDSGARYVLAVSLTIDELSSSLRTECNQLKSVGDFLQAIFYCNSRHWILSFQRRWEYRKAESYTRSFLPKEIKGKPYAIRSAKVETY